MRQASFYVFLLISVFNTNLNAQWTNLGSGIESIPRQIWGMHVVNEDIIWAITAFRATDFTPTFEFTKTTDGGKTWQLGLLDIPSELYHFDIFALDDQTAWLTTADELDPIAGKVFKTTNGGLSWTEQSTGFTGFNETPAAIYFWNSNEGVAFGATCLSRLNDQLAIYTTNDSGDNWVKVGLENMPAQKPREGICWSGGEGNYEVVGDTIWFVSSEGRIFRSINKGLQWEVFDAGFERPLGISIAFRDALNGIVVGDVNKQNFAARTTDGGQNWTAVPIPNSTIAAQIEFIPKTNGTYLIQNASAPGNGDLLITYNEGESWETIASSTNLVCMEFISDQIGFGGGVISDAENGGMYKWSGPSLNRFYVKADAAGTNNGSNWENAYTNLQDAIDAATEDSEIWVAAGTYIPTGAATPRNSRFLIKKNLKLYGGFAGTETALSERSATNNLTVLSGDVLGDDSINDFENNRTDNLMTVIWVTSDMNESAVIDGFTIKGGHADLTNSAGTGQSGGGLYCRGNPLIANCRFEQNYAIREGGGAYFAHDKPLVLENNHFENNNSGEFGGGLHEASGNASPATFRNCTFISNRSVRGGGLNSVSSNSTVTNCTFRANQSTQHGGGLRHSQLENGLTARVIDCIFEDNNSSFGGGYRYETLADSNKVYVTGCSFNNNQGLPLQEGWGYGAAGAILVFFQGFVENYALMENCIFYQNSSTDGDFSSGAVSFLSDAQNSKVEVKKSQFIENTAFQAGGMEIINSSRATGEVSIDSCHFEKNISSTFAGGLLIGNAFFDGATVDFNLTNSTFLANEALEGGALAMFCDDASTGNFKVSKCHFEDNIGKQNGGAIQLLPGSSDFAANISHSVIKNNQSPNGAVAHAYLNAFFGSVAPDNTSTIMDNCLIIENSSEQATFLLDSLLELTLLNCTVADNFGQTVQLEGKSSFHIQNTILYNPGFLEYKTTSTLATITSKGGNLIQDNSMMATLMTNDLMETNPLFEGNGNYQLSEDSPCIDAGVETGSTATEDLAGNPRFQGNQIDIGTYESSFATTSNENLISNEVKVYPNPSTDFLTIDLPNNEPQSSTISLYNINGNLVGQHLLQFDKPLDISYLSQGLYSFKVTAFNNIYTGKFIKY